MPEPTYLDTSPDVSAFLESADKAAMRVSLEIDILLAAKVNTSTTVNGLALTGNITIVNITGNAGTVSSIGNLTGPVTSVNRATAIANNALSIAMTNGLQTALDGKSPLAGSINVTTLGTITTGTWQGSIIAPAYLGTGTDITTKFLRGDGTWQTISVGGGSGDVVGPDGGVVEGELAAYSSTTGKGLEGTGIVFSNPGVPTINFGPGEFNLGGTGTGFISFLASGGISIYTTSINSFIDLSDTGFAVTTGSVSRFDATADGFRIASGARITTIRNTAAGDSSSETVGVTAGWVKSFGPVRTVTTATVDGVNGYTYIIDSGRTGDTTINFDTTIPVSFTIINQSAHNVLIYNEADLSTSGTACGAKQTALVKLDYDAGTVVTMYRLPSKALGEDFGGNIALTGRTDGQVITPAGTTITGTTANLSAAAHANKRTRCTNGSAITLTLLNQTNGEWQDGDVVIIRRANGAGPITINAESPATIEGNVAATVPANADFALVRTASNTWDFV